MSGQKIIKGLQDAVAFAKGDQSRARLITYNTLSSFELKAAIGRIAELEAINSDLLAALRKVAMAAGTICIQEETMCVRRHAPNCDCGGDMVRAAIARAQGK